MPGRGTPRRVIRMGDVLWERFGQAAGRAGADRAALIRQFVLWYARYPGAELPERPPDDPPPA